MILHSSWPRTAEARPARAGASQRARAWRGGQPRWPQAARWRRGRGTCGRFNSSRWRRHQKLIHARTARPERGEREPRRAVGPPWPGACRTARRLEHVVDSSYMALARRAGDSTHRPIEPILCWPAQDPRTLLGRTSEQIGVDLVKAVHVLKHVEGYHGVEGARRLVQTGVDIDVRQVHAVSHDPSGTRVEIERDDVRESLREEGQHHAQAGSKVEDAATRPRSR